MGMADAQIEGEADVLQVSAAEKDADSVTEGDPQAESEAAAEAVAGSTTRRATRRRDPDSEADSTGERDAGGDMLGEPPPPVHSPLHVSTKIRDAEQHQLSRVSVGRLKLLLPRVCRGKGGVTRIRKAPPPRAATVAGNRPNHQ